jgi:hypothetical protein
MGQAAAEMASLTQNISDTIAKKSPNPATSQ